MRPIAPIVAGLLMLAPAAPAQAQSDIADKIINGTIEVVGAKPKIRSDKDVQGGKAMRVNIARKGVNPWDVFVSSKIEKPVKAGDNLVLAYWARLEKGENGATAMTPPFSGVQLSSAPYSTILSAPVEIDGTWKLHQVKGKATKDYQAGELGVSVHLAAAKQIVDIGPVFVVNLGQ